jgi:hypothetical protein
MASRAVVRSGDHVQNAQELFAPQKMMQDLAGCAPMVPRSVHLLMVAYYFEIEPKDLIGRVQFRCRNMLAFGGEIGPHDGLTVFFAYNRIEKLFNQLVAFGKEYGDGGQTFAKAWIQSVAETEYRYHERIPEGITPHACWSIGNVKSDLKSWHFHLGKDVHIDIANATIYRRTGSRGGWHMDRCDTRYEPGADAMSLEQAIVYARQVEHMNNVRKILEDLQIKSDEPARQLKLCSPAQNLKNCAPVEISQVDESDPSVPKDCQDLTKEIEPNVPPEDESRPWWKTWCTVS